MAKASDEVLARLEVRGSRSEALPRDNCHEPGGLCQNARTVMLKVECEGCRSPYKVDERRVPPGGLKMRCPKCGATFVVRRPGSEDGDAPAPPPPAAPPAPAARPVSAKRTMLGVGGPAVSEPRAPKPPPPPPAADASLEADLDLPVVSAGLPAAKPLPGGAKPGPVPPVPPPLAAPPAARKPAPAPLDDLGIDLPALSLGGPAAGPARAPAVPQQARAPAAGAVPPPLDFGIDLDVQTPPEKPGAGGDALDDLPTLSGRSDLPALAQGAGGVDLPSPAERAGLPAVAPGAAGLPSFARSGGGDERPARQITGAVLGFDEPPVQAKPAPVAPPRAAPARSAAPAPASGFGDAFGELDLPLVADPVRDLPAPTNLDAHLPAAADGARHLPAPADPLRNLPSITGGGPGRPAPISPPSLGSAAIPASLPPVFGMGPDDGAWQAIPPATKATGTLSSAPPPADFQGIGDSAASAASAASPPAAESEAPPISEGPLVRQAGGGTAFGEVNLAQTEAGPSAEVAVPARVSRPGGAGWGERRPGQPSDDDMEFGAIPQEDGAGGEKPQRGSSGAAEAQAVPAMQQAAGARASATGAAGAQVQLPPKKSRAVRILGALLLVVVAGGGALAATPYGAFGAHAIGDAVHAKEYGRLLGSTVQETRKNLGRDTAEAASEAGTQCDEAQTRAPRFAPLTAYAAFVGFQREVRYGADPAIHAHATAQLADAAKRSKDAEYLALASAAEALASGRVAKARAEAGALAQRYPDDIDVAVLAAEVETFAGEASAALEAWQRAARLSPTARTAHGLARAHFALGQLDKAREQADKALAFTPDHVGARILLSRVLRKAGDDERAMARVEEVTKLPATRAAASKSELVAAHTLVGQIHLARSRMSMSEAAFGEALKLDPKDAGALCGFGEVLYREGRFTEALARYEAGLQADAESVAAKIGTAKTKIALDRLQDAKDILRKLRESRPADPVVAYWLARVEEALGNKAEVEKILVDAIARTPPSQGAIDLYVAYAQFLSAQGRAQESDAKLAEARQKLPDTPLVHKALGEVALSAGRTDDAKREFEAALQRDPQDLAAMFNLAVTLRRIARFDDAQAMFDKVAAADKNYPGLALERGVLFEASGQAQRALEMYQEALSKAPDDPDLMLRVGSAEVAAGHAAQAEEILRKVLQARPNGAEANHYLGRALLLKGNNLAEALRYLQRAAEIDPNRAEYWLYIGWAANEAGQPSNAQETLKKALELDKGLADAYWQRGILLRRQGAIRDAERDLLKAIELKPSRFEAHATLAECYEDQARWPNAIGAWRKAISADGTRSFWRYKLGRLLYNNGNRAEAGEELAHAVQLAIKEARPHWLWEAYLMLAETNKAAGRRTEAATYYREFLKLAPSESPFRNDALRELQKMGERLD